MEIPKPLEATITVYSKSGCINCVNVKKLLKEKDIKFTIINCDEFILEDKPGFLLFIQNLAGREYNTFPMVFSHHTFIGGFKETETYFNKLNDQKLDFNSDF